VDERGGTDHDYATVIRVPMVGRAEIQYKTEVQDGIWQHAADTLGPSIS